MVEAKKNRQKCKTRAHTIQAHILWNQLFENAMGIYRMNSKSTLHKNRGHMYIFLATTTNAQRFAAGAARRSQTGNAPN